MVNKTKYSAIADEALNENDNDSAESTYYSNPPRRWTSTRSWGFILFVTLTLFALAIFDYISRPLSQKQEPLLVSTNCGNSSDEARARGCVFDLMSWCWLPPACHDAELSEQFLRENGPWDWYLDLKATLHVDQEEVAKGNTDLVYVAESYHQIHCAYVWSKMHRAYMGQGAMDSYIGSFNHTKHCSEVLLRSDFSWTKVDTYVWLKYPTCDIRTSRS